LVIYDPDHSRHEDRWVSIGISVPGRLLVVCHTYREETLDFATVRIFSSRKAKPHETKQYQD